MAQVTDPAGNWKQYVSDALGNLTAVREPNPAAPSDHNQDFWTYYTYDLLGHLTQVQMPRGGTTQYRSFNYQDMQGRVGANLLSATNPENGTVTYTYNADNTVSTRIDAKGQKTAYSYDISGRPTQIRHYPDGTHEDASQQVNLYYESYFGWGINTQGRLAAATNANVVEEYSYTPAGLISEVSMQAYNTVGSLSYTYNNEGQVASVSYPATYSSDSDSWVDGPVYSYSFDTMGRPSGMVQQDTQATVVSGVQYGAGGQILQMQDVRAIMTHTFQYNNLLQLTRVTTTAYGDLAMDVQYTYSATQNNGKITQSQDFVTGEQVSYQYDCLQRLISASTSGPQWGLSFSYGSVNLWAVTLGPAPDCGVIHRQAALQDEFLHVA